MENPSNKRKSKRFDCYVPVDGKEGAGFTYTKTVDISRDGIGFVSHYPAKLNEKVAIELVLKPDTEPVLVVGEVKWVNRIAKSDQYRVGLTFADIIDGKRADIDSVLNARFLHQEMKG